jgi:hypothetical protein
MLFGASHQITFGWGLCKRFSPPTAAEFSFERHVIFTISLREIVKMTCLSKHNLARSTMKGLFTQPLSKKYSAAEGGKAFRHNPFIP